MSSRNSSANSSLDSCSLPSFKSMSVYVCSDYHLAKDSRGSLSRFLEFFVQLHSLWHSVPQILATLVSPDCLQAKNQRPRTHCICFLSLSLALLLSQCLKAFSTYFQHSSSCLQQCGQFYYVIVPPLWSKAKVFTLLFVLTIYSGNLLYKFIDIFIVFLNIQFHKTPLYLYIQSSQPIYSLSPIFFAITNNTIMNSLVHIFFHNFCGVYLLLIPKGVIASS